MANWDGVVRCVVTWVVMCVESVWSWEEMWGKRVLKWKERKDQMGVRIELAGVMICDAKWRI